MFNDSPPQDWLRPYTLADVLFIEALSPDVRAAVERYVRKNVHGAKDLRLVPKDTVVEDEYQRGWEDAIEAVESELQVIHLPRCPEHKEREKRQARRRRYA